MSGGGGRRAAGELRRRRGQGDKGREGEHVTGGSGEGSAGGGRGARGRTSPAALRRGHELRRGARGRCAQGAGAGRGADPGRRAGGRVRLPYPTYPTKRKGAGLAALPPALPTYLPTYAGRQSSRRTRELQRRLNTTLKPLLNKGGLLSEQARKADKAGAGIIPTGGGGPEKQTPEGGE